MVIASRERRFRRRDAEAVVTRVRRSLTERTERMRTGSCTYRCRTHRQIVSCFQV